MRRKILAGAAIAIAAALLALTLPGGTALAQAKKGEKKAAPEKKEQPAKEGKDKSGEADAKKETFDLEATGTLGALAKGSADMYELTYTIPEKGKKVQKKAWLKVDSGSALLCDRPCDVTAFKEGDTLKVFAIPDAREASAPGGVPSGGKSFKVFKAARVIFGGRDLTVNKSFTDPKSKDHQWCDCTVDKAGKAMSVKYDDGTYKLAPENGAAFLRRDEGNAKKDLKKGARVLVQASVAEEKPSGEKEDRPSYRAVRLIVMAPIQNWAAAIYP